MVLAGDIGGTKAHLALFSRTPTGLDLVKDRSLPSAGFPTLEALIKAFVGPSELPEAICLGVPGPVVDGKARITNLPWSLDADVLRENLGVARVLLLNDLEATAWGIGVLQPEELRTLNGGECRTGSAALIAAGTGLGESILFWNGARHVPSPSEGGHCSFSPRNPQEIDLLNYLAGSFGHVSWERVLSGPGLSNIYKFLRDSGRGSEDSRVAERMRAEDPNAVIAELGLLGTDALCSRTLDLFVSLYGSEAGNLALKAMAVAGVYIGGGIAPKIAAKFADGSFMRAFLDKGRLRELLERIPVHLILNPSAGLFGAARYTLLAVGDQRLPVINRCGPAESPAGLAKSNN
ncbi:MAG TPA: glucokinase [Terriglobales bacterium]|nr:glucokinase [Terriglobales bacterium]